MSVASEQFEINVRAYFPDPSVAVELFRRHFFNRTDRVAFKPSWASDACPAEGGDNLDQLLTAHVAGPEVPAVKIRWLTEAGKSGTESGHFRIATYSPAIEGSTLYACVDCDGGGRHAKPLADPLGAALEILDALQRLSLPAWLEKSGGGSGWHVWLFFERPVPAFKIRKLLFAICPKNLPLKDGGTASAESHTGLEVFPKQDRIRETGVGNMVWLPWWHGAAAEDANVFHRVDESGELAPFLPIAFEEDEA